MLLTSPEPSELLLPFLQPLSSSSSLVRPAPTKGMASTYATSPLAPLPSFLGGGIETWEAQIVGTPWTIGVQLYFPVEVAEWEGRGGRRRGGLGKREQLPFRIPWAAVPTCLPTLNPPRPRVCAPQGPGGWSTPLCMDICEVQMVSCGLRPHSWPDGTWTSCPCVGAGWTPPGSIEGGTQLLLPQALSEIDPELGEGEGRGALLVLPVLTISA